MTKLLTLIILFVFTNLFAQKQFTISGKLDGFDENALVKISINNAPIDSVVLVKGGYKLEGKLKEVPSSVYITVKNGKDYHSALLFIGNEKITLNATKKDFPYDVKTSGSEYDEMRYKYAQFDKDYTIKRREFLTDMMSLREQNKWNDSLQKAYWGKVEPYGKITALDNEFAKNSLQFYQDNINSYYTLSLVNSYKTELSKEVLIDLMNKLESKYKKSAYYKSIMTDINTEKLNIGDSYIDFMAYNQSNKKANFSDYFKGKYVLLDFTTFYCGFSLESIPVLDQIKTNNRDKLEIVSFYVDKEEIGYKNFLLKHAEDWISLWDKEGRTGGTYTKYKIIGTPTFYLFNPEGKLILADFGLDEKKITESIK